ncbi:hypothetical protein ACFFGT_24470 [Mucilaginibacter angelicae]|uniref:DUF4252 domain-containing protein n=1 Tax=Mucilaginibacter angelicae TaxID=869718 RepID=A0ABV6LD51_9SPHI
MKRTLFLIGCILMCFDVYGQSLSFVELKDSINHGYNSDSAYLVSKGLILTPTKIKVEAFSTFKKNEGKVNEEIVEYNKGGLAYESKDLYYINKLLKQVKAQYKLKRITLQLDPHNNHASGTRYEFTTGKIAIAFIRFKSYGIIGFDFVRPYWQ